MSAVTTELAEIGKTYRMQVYKSFKFIGLCFFLASLFNFVFVEFL